MWLNRFLFLMLFLSSIRKAFPLYISKIPISKSPSLMKFYLCICLKPGFSLGQQLHLLFLKIQPCCLLSLYASEPRDKKSMSCLSLTLLAHSTSLGLNDNQLRLSYHQLLSTLSLIEIPLSTFTPSTYQPQGNFSCLWWLSVRQLATLSSSDSSLVLGNFNICTVASPNVPIS